MTYGKIKFRYELNPFARRVIASSIEVCDDDGNVVRLEKIESNDDLHGYHNLLLYLCDQDNNISDIESGSYDGGYGKFTWENGNLTADPFGSSAKSYPIHGKMYARYQDESNAYIYVPVVDGLTKFTYNVYLQYEYAEHSAFREEHIPVEIGTGYQVVTLLDTSDLPHVLHRGAYSLKATPSLGLGGGNPYFSVVNYFKARTDGTLISDMYYDTRCYGDSNRVGDSYKNGHTGYGHRARCMFDITSICIEYRPSLIPSPSYGNHSKYTSSELSETDDPYRYFMKDVQRFMDKQSDGSYVFGDIYYICKLRKFDWTVCNGFASASNTQQSHDALVNHSGSKLFKIEVWDDIMMYLDIITNHYWYVENTVDKQNRTGTHDKYGTFTFGDFLDCIIGVEDGGSTSIQDVWMTSRGIRKYYNKTYKYTVTETSVLTAERFNYARDAILTIKPAYADRLPRVNTGDVVKADYLLAMVDFINECVAEINGE